MQYKLAKPETGIAPDGLQKCSSQCKCHHQGTGEGADSTS